MNNYVLNHLKKTITDHSATFLATLFSMSVVLSCLSLILLARQNLVRLAETWGQDSEITAYLEDGLPSKEQKELEQKIQAMDHVKQVQFVSKTDAAKKFLERMGHLSPDFLQSDKPEENPLPATFDIKISADISLTERIDILKQLATQISEYSGVSDVTFGQGWIESWGRFLQKFNLATLFAVGVVLVIGLLIIGNATRVSMERRLEEVEVLELVGATRRWIQRPFLIEGALLGLGSALFSLILSMFLNKAVLGYFSSAGWMWIENSRIELSMSSAIVILLTGLGFGLLGSYFCVRKIGGRNFQGEMDSYV
ncbi:MAG TPA: hypothetical protein DCL41_05685 [Bdellovibrionales bacterium]|nr:hypothetical protein [Pseudobdellovibrionaceae bacterium]HAG91340.1 hypothetical protein [Bdellovibrionales bacterium]|tara:strand:- start:39359 stop:40291 length:933 start_codon:yes stop_codon:yes gene_type:complete